MSEINLQEEGARVPRASSTLRRSATMSKAVPGIATVLGILFVTTGLLKFGDFQKFADYYRAAGNPRWVFFGSGTIELASGLALLVPRFRRYAVWTLLSMIFVISWQPWNIHDSSFLVSQTVLIGLLMLLASIL